MNVVDGCLPHQGLSDYNLHMSKIDNDQLVDDLRIAIETMQGRHPVPYDTPTIWRLINLIEKLENA